MRALLGTPPPTHVQDMQAPSSADHVPEKVEVAILGTGLTAAAMAYFLARAGANVALISPRDNLLDASTRGLGVLMPGAGEDPVRLARALGLSDALEVYRFSLSALQTLRGLQLPLPFELRETAALAVGRSASEAKDLEKSGLLAQQEALPAVYLEGVEAAAQAGRGARCALLWQQAATVNPALLTLSLAKGAVDAGARLSLGRAVVGVDEDEHGAVLRTDGGTIRAEILIFAGGLESNALQPLLERHVLVAGVQHCGSAAVTYGPSLPASANYGFEYWRRGPDGELWIGGFRYLSLELGLLRRGDELERRVNNRQEAVAGELCGGMVPPVTHRWVRLLELSRDGLPLIGPVPGQPRQWVLSGCGGLESTLGLEGARRVAQLLSAAGSASSLPLRFSPRRFL